METLRIAANFDLQDGAMSTHGLPYMVGESPAFRHVLARIKRFAISQWPVLICGETGTGKELAARALHYFGHRSRQAFIPVNCAALPDSMFESEVFGHVKGAFTDAKQQQTGLVGQAQHGSLFLDEVDTLSARGQASLLRFIQDRRYRQLGGERMITADVNIIAATNTNLAERVAEGSFRKDLYFRLNAITIPLPALRERREDIPLLAQYFLRYFAEQYQQPLKQLHHDSIAWLVAQEWPGNIRELQQLLHREILLSDADELHFGAPLHEMPARSPQLDWQQYCFQTNFKAQRSQVIAEFEKQYLIRLMQHTHGNISAAARLIGKERRALGRMLQKHAIDKQTFEH